MGLDLYAGSLTRYYSGDWLTTMQRVGKQLGMEVAVSYAAGESPWLSHDEAGVAVKKFLSALSERWGARFPYFAPGPRWNESPRAPYDTEKPDHDGVRALDVFAAYLARPDLTRPPVLPDLATDPAVAEANTRGYYMEHMVAIEAHLFLPGDANFVVVADDPLGARRFITSVGTLEAVLRDVNDRSWRGSASDLEAWLRRGLVPWKGAQKVFDDATGELVEEPVKVDDRLEHNAQFALACFLRLCAFSRKHDVPIVVDQ